MFDHTCVRSNDHVRAQLMLGLNLTHPRVELEFYSAYAQFMLLKFHVQFHAPNSICLLLSLFSTVSFFVYSSPSCKVTLCKFEFLFEWITRFCTRSRQRGCDSSRFRIEAVIKDYYWSCSCLRQRPCLCSTHVEIAFNSYLGWARPANPGIIPGLS